MIATIVKIALFLCIIALPLLPTQKRRRVKLSKEQATEERSKYAVNEDGYIEMFKQEEKEF
ncbi:hypothetical protein DIU31_024070 [Mucilaginibacter rubeus]|uniref:Uncharacterized protein n=1 Tax=Mucilaginibacter rubeus TaxID=2027860 RepID=A0AAE6MKH1_9SPHI|nr:MULTISPECIES: hypothetical protein [Mucilaginibacter]QEM06439.1 hypothetical protein DIU31_024070 [Mucilaginibacter rubeus]QEM19023.1 hypothetical protein DIU38_024300 [Mucilaginibacter gossypii]QTE44434.1 hypothetical protein J3L19_03400 [Mucilaginibacter rubeus]QTE51033.1 hypothetical protein J3L21_03375 [Mucilaginibacter rubeus]QTE56116.1 hypothetical protein J3L23_28615 [Mucilaginibacter rubeus]